MALGAIGKDDERKEENEKIIEFERMREYQVSPVKEAEDSFKMYQLLSL